MDKKELEELARKFPKDKGQTVVVSFRIPKKLADKIEKRGTNVNQIARELALPGLERLAD